MLRYVTYDIHVDGHAKTGDVRLFFFHYDCYVGDRLLISVRNGQAGFFTTEELAGSHGVLWKPEDDEPDPDARLDAPPRLSTKRSFTAEEVGHWVEGDAWRCFGDGFELAASHTRAPNTPDGRLRLIDHVPEFDPEGGPWGRGYLRAEAHVPADAWFYEGHFRNDPCMPGTLMAAPPPRRCRSPWPPWASRSGATGGASSPCRARCPASCAAAR